MLISTIEVQQCFGSDATVAAIKDQFARRFKDNVKQINDARASGRDCKEVDLDRSGKGQI
jgi:hypothetical protein